MKFRSYKILVNFKTSSSPRKFGIKWKTYNSYLNYFLSSGPGRKSLASGVGSRYIPIWKTEDYFHLTGNLDNVGSFWNYLSIKYGFGMGFGVQYSSLTSCGFSIGCWSTRSLDLSFSRRDCSCLISCVIHFIRFLSSLRPLVMVFK